MAQTDPPNQASNINTFILVIINNVWNTCRKQSALESPQPLMTGCNLIVNWFQWLLFRLDGHSQGNMLLVQCLVASLEHEHRQNKYLSAHP